MVRIWEEWIRLSGNSKPLPVIFPVVLAQHRGIWKLSTQFSALFGKAASLDFLRPFLPDFAFRLHRNDPFGVNQWVKGADRAVRRRVGGVPECGGLLRCEFGSEAMPGELMERFRGGSQLTGTVGSGHRLLHDPRSRLQPAESF